MECLGHILWGSCSGHGIADVRVVRALDDLFFRAKLDWAQALLCSADSAHELVERRV